MSYLEERISNLTEEELKQCFEEIKSYNETGILESETLIRSIRKEYCDSIGISTWDTGCKFTCMEILYEIAKRKYK